MLKLNDIMGLQRKPALFTPGTHVLWTDPYVAQHLLATHLDSSTDLASYKRETIERITRFIVQELNLTVGMSILDAGCGPGLYCECLEKNGLNVTGLDFSCNSIDYARQSALKNELPIRYLVGDYLEMDFNGEFDCILNIFYDFCVLSFEDRSRFLKNVHQALKPGGYFVLDVTTPLYEERPSDSSGWSAHQEGFWSPEPHLVLENHFYYPEETAILNQYAVFGEDFKKLYRIYHLHYTLEHLNELLMSHGFRVMQTYEDLTGKPLSESAKTMGIIARRI